MQKEMQGNKEGKKKTTKQLSQQASRVHKKSGTGKMVGFDPECNEIIIWVKECSLNFPTWILYDFLVICRVFISEH